MPPSFCPCCIVISVRLTGNFGELRELLMYHFNCVDLKGCFPCLAGINCRRFVWVSAYVFLSKRLSKGCDTFVSFLYLPEKGQTAYNEKAQKALTTIFLNLSEDLKNCD